MQTAEYRLGDHLSVRGYWFMAVFSQQRLLSLIRDTERYRNSNIDKLKPVTLLFRVGKSLISFADGFPDHTRSCGARGLLALSDPSGSAPPAVKFGVAKAAMEKIRLDMVSANAAGAFNVIDQLERPSAN